MNYYLDYNATAPLAESVLNWMREGSIPFGNPASLHQEGRKAKALIHETTNYLHELFGLSPQNFEIIYHTGATEGVNWISQGFVYALRDLGKNPTYAFSQIDHPTSRSLSRFFRSKKITTYEIPILANGDLDQEKLSNLPLSTETLLNYLYVSNETGVIWPLEQIVAIKKKTGCFVHVDAVQLPGKIENWNLLDPSLDAYTFSGHKFGAFKNVGFSFIRKGLPLKPLFWGGGQQKGLRPGTENAVGIYSLKLALQNLMQTLDLNSLRSGKDYLEKSLLEQFPTKVEIVGRNSKNRNANTITLIVKGAHSDVLSAALDIKGLQVGTGSACSSGSVEPNHILQTLGYDSELARSGLRLSLPFCFTQAQAQEVLAILTQVFNSFL